MSTQPSRGHVSRADEDPNDSNSSLSQKEAITAQMIGIISTRLGALQTLANDRKVGLECDLRVNSNHSSKMVAALQDPYESRVSANSRVKPVSATMLASNQAMMERLFGSDEKNRLRTVLKKNKAELQKNENRRNARVHLEKQLQASVEGHITRTVDSFVYGGGGGGSGALSSNGGSGGNTTVSCDGDAVAMQSAAGPSITVNSKLLLLHTCERMRITHGKKNFKRFLLSDVSRTLFEDIFWLVFCHFFQKHSAAPQRTLVDTVSARYVKIISTLRGSGDYIFRVFPYAVASGVCWGFHYLFPGSRHLYSIEFKNNVFLFVCQLLLGLKLCPVSVQTMRRQFFPEEMLDDGILKSSNHSGNANATTGASGLSQSAMGVMPDLSSLLPRLNSSQSTVEVGTPATELMESKSLRASVSESSLSRHPLSENSVEMILQSTPQSTAASGGVTRPTDTTKLGQSESARQLRTHQLRTSFNATQLSPLMKEYLGKHDGPTKKPYYLLRTTPFSNCSVGGEDTYHKYYRRRSHKSHGVEAQREQQDKCIRDIQKSQHDMRRELTMLDETREIVLTSGKKALQAYCTLLLSKKSNPEAEAGATGGPGNAGG